MRQGRRNAIDALVPTMTGATALLAGTKGYVPAPSAGDEAKFLSWRRYVEKPTSTSRNRVYDTGKYGLT